MKTYYRGDQVSFGRLEHIPGYMDKLKEHKDMGIDYKVGCMRHLGNGITHDLIVLLSTIEFDDNDNVTNTTGQTTRTIV